ncbi:MAG: AMP-binding protein [Peptostreptococcus sp.]|uniref:class I adenylate-forming enzyme family protein n=1 Tax=Peptostreptococcus TaxID=1257 RepID=UPI000766F0E0|nr:MULTISPECIES: AMP-binding protein [Peptostreptococcus]KXB73607.1 AMP-binding enzyme [Peptostreptococcus anaerobius]MDU1265453.1 AMP-binding protein [Peptostreptococcus sp.]
MELTNKTISEYLEDRAEMTPESAFIRHGEEIYTWKSVNNITSKMALVLLEQGVKKGDKVGIYGVNSSSWIIIFFALQKIGAVAVLINSCYKEKELYDCIKIADMKFLFYTTVCTGYTCDLIVEKLKKRSDLKKVNFYKIEHTYEEWMKIEKRECKIKRGIFDKPNSEDTACILFTSGTTNICKGVILSHRSLVNNAREVCEQMRWTEKDSMCLVVPLFHCFGVNVSLLTSLIAGMTVTLLDKYKTVSVCEAIEKYKCTVLNGVPSMFLAMTKNPKFDEFDLSSLKSGIIAGSPIYKEDYIGICNKLKGMKLQTSYGLTEASPCVSISDYEDSIEKKAVSAGKVIDHIDVRIIDLDTGKECPRGQVGEIFVKGYNVTSGYLSSDPVVCDAVRPDGWLKTGDLAYMDEDSYLYIVGRRKNLIIRGGENISPQEIEECIKDYNNKLDVLVIGVKSDVLQEEIVAVIEGRQDDEMVGKIKEYMRDSISSYKIPKYFVFIESFPRNATGKINEKALKEIVNEKLK